MRESRISKEYLGGRWEGGSCLGMHVRIKDFKIKKLKKKKKKRVSWGSEEIFLVWFKLDQNRCACQEDKP